MKPSQVTNRIPLQHRQFPVSEHYIFVITLILLCVTLLYTGWTKRLDYILYDTFLRSHSQSTSSASVIVAIDEKSLDIIGQWPWDRAIHAQLIDRVKHAGAKAVVFDVLMAEKSSYTSDQLLASSMRIADNVFLPLHIDYHSATGRLTEILPIPELVSSTKGLGHAHFELDEDGIARGLYLFHGVGDSHWPSLALAAHQFKQPNHQITKTSDNKPHNSNLLNIREAYRLIPFLGPPGSFTTISYSDVLYNVMPDNYFKDRVVFVGATASGLGDFLATPVSGEYNNMPGVEVHANVYEALSQQKLSTLISPQWQYFITLSLVLAIAMTFPRIAPDKNLPLTIAITASICTFSFLLLKFNNQWFNPSPLLVTLFFAYPFWSWRRLYQLNRFFNQELKRLAGEPKIKKITSFESPQQWAQQVVRLLNPGSWEFKDFPSDDELLFNFNDKSNTLEVTIPIEATSEQVALHMHFEADEEKLHAIVTYIKRLFPELNQNQSSTPKPGELMDLRIMQVRQAIATMQDMRLFISHIVANMPEGVVVGDEFGRILFLNHPARQWLEADPKSGNLIADHMPISHRISPHRWEVIIRDALLYGKLHTEELYLDKAAILVAITPINFPHNLSTGMVITFTDITKIHDAQQKRLETIHFISHDLRAPLASQLALLDTLKVALPKAFEAKLEAAQALTTKSLAMSDQFLQLARVEAADHIHLYECELLDIVDNAVDSTVPLAFNHLININTFCDYDSIPLIGNAELLERALVNLLQNAIKFSPTQAEITIHLEQEEDFALVRVQDQGPGIAEHEIPTLFEPYRRTKASEQNGIQGAGLGLRFVRLVMDRHGGKVTITSETGHGSTFTLHIPRDKTQQPEKTSIEASEKVSSAVS